MSLTEPITHAAEPGTGTLTTVVDVIGTASGLEPEEISGDSRISDLAIDSLSLVEIAVRLEDAFGIRIVDTDMDRFGTVADIVALVDERAAEDASGQ
ncbi:acyl carrier protein [Corynebacterium sp. CCM 8835]|uniref:Acyl carrier protein n=1 Tax=Corynebacterium antarcticum TaxID=2800405 RepID=A0A9Q4GM81_9CORY|nr:acyl carrier protein [Corynebacterium antarcticum]MCK7641883.1 acyl carrier protein [Corynebacterium antarcticum]MCK7660010.1 acyl carrier protein [Corynebacterium antarcticum]MCL0245112.1 acyl carrier protein [Corynebacterium antarcticum]MCX7491547.1 acyl carrier protein [Corynebacterium antarcticum]MCX7537506.1 acyl carrier protein [Corynebacterium antarcticum]